MKIAIYLTAIPRNKSETKLAVLKRFGEGILKSSDQVEFVNGFSTVDCDVAVMQGFVHKDVTPPHLQLRKRILETHKNVIVIDSNLFQFANAELKNYYFQLLAFILIIKLIIQGGCLLVTNLTLN